MRPSRSPFIVRAAGPRDGERVAEMCAALAREEGGPPSRFSAEAFRRDGFGREPAFACAVAERDGAVLGYALHCPGYDTDRLTRGIYLADLYVEKTARREGVGRALVAAVARAGRQQGARVMRWAVLRRNGPARLFYTAIGREQDELLICSVEGTRFRRLAEASQAPGAAARPRVIRPARPADSGRLAAMLRSFNAEMGGPSPANAEAILHADGFGPGAVFACLIAEEDGAPAGYALFLPAYDTESSGRGGFLSDLYVLPAARRRGLARALLAASARATRRRGGNFLYWEVLKSNGPARALYRTVAEELEDIVLCVCEEERFERLAQ